MKRILVNRLSMIIALTVVMIASWCMISTADVRAAVDVSAPRTYDSVAIWDTVYFGSYPQSDSSGSRKDKIQWRVLAVDDQKIMLISEYKLDEVKYNTTRKQVDWSACTMRTWLNGTFMNTAFNSSEKADLVYVNNDYVTVPSKSEICNASYGFISDRARSGYNTNYLQKRLNLSEPKVGYTLMSFGAYWLRDKPSSTGQAVLVRGSGSGTIDTSSYYVDGICGCARPIIYVRRNSVNLTYASKVSTTEATKPSTPGNMNLTRKNFNQVEVTWDRCPDADGYKIYRLVGDSYVLKKTITSRDIISWTETGLPLGKTHTYKVMSYWNTGDTILTGDSSEECSVSVPKLKAPGSFKVVKKSGKRAKATWGVTTGATGYQVSFQVKYKKSGKIRYATKKVYTKNRYSTGSYSGSGCKVLRYSVKVRAYRLVNSVKVYGPWTITKSVSY